jgi:2-methylcitrate dehydratase PrpD
MTVEQELVSNVLETQFKDFDPATVNYAKTRIMDTIGALLGGIHSSGADMLLAMVRDWGGKPQSTVLGMGDKLPAPGAVLAMGIMARSNDFEVAGGPDINGAKSPGHYSATSVPTAFAVAEKLGLSGKDIITAVILGDDLAARIGAAGAGPWDLGWDPAATCPRFAAAAIAGKLMGLSRDQMLNALGIALTQIGGTMLPTLEYTHSFKIGQGLAAWNGIISADLAGRGFTGPANFLFGNFGYYQQFCREVRAEVITVDLGRKFYGDEEFKLFPCCRGNHSSIETALKLVNQHKIDPLGIKDIRIELSPAWKGSFLIQPFKIDCSPQAAAILNLSYNVASVLLRKDIKLEYFTDQAVRDPRIAGLVDKIKIDLTAAGKRMASRIIISMEDGREFSGSTEVPRGDYRLAPLTQAEIKNKFFTSVDFSGAVSSTQAKQAYLLLDNLEEQDNLSELINALIPSGKGL